MKKFFTLIKSALLGALVLLTVNCSKTGGDYRSLVPADGFVTVSINGQSILDKAGFSDAERAAFKGQAELGMMMLGGMFDESDKKLVLSIMDSPDNTGISFNDDIYVSVRMGNVYEDPNDVQVAVIARVNDAKKLGKLFALAQKLSPDFEVRSDRGLDIVIFDESEDETTLLAYNNSAAVLFYNAGDYSSTIQKVAETFKGSKPLANDKNLSKFMDGRNDLGMLINYGPLLSLTEMESQMAIPFMDMYKSAYISTHTNFEKGKIETDMSIMFADKENEKEFREFYGDSRLNGKFAKYLSDQAIFAMGGYLSGTRIYESLLQMPQTSMIGFIPHIGTIMEALEGEVFISLSGISSGGAVTATLLAAVQNPDILDFILDEYGMYVEDMIRVNGDYYVIDIAGQTFTFGIKDDVFFIGNDAEIMAALDGYSVNQPAGDIVKMFEKGFGAIYLNMDNLMAQFAHHFWLRGNVDPSMAIVMEFIQLFDDVRIYGEDPNECKIVVTMDDKDRNALSGLVDMIRSLAMSSIF